MGCCSVSCRVRMALSRVASRVGNGATLCGPLLLLPLLLGTELLALLVLLLLSLAVLAAAKACSTWAS